MNHISFRAPLLVAALFTVSGAASAQSAGPSAEKGRVAFINNGCWQCHGFVGQGGVAGPKLAPDPRPLVYLEAFIRNSNGPMPPYSEKVLSKADLADIHAYLAAQPKTPDYKTIPLLNMPDPAAKPATAEARP